MGGLVVVGAFAAVFGAMALGPSLLARARWKRVARRYHLSISENALQASRWRLRGTVRGIPIDIRAVPSGGGESFVEIEAEGAFEPVDLTRPLAAADPLIALSLTPHQRNAIRVLQRENARLRAGHLSVKLEGLPSRHLEEQVDDVLCAAEALSSRSRDLRLEMIVERVGDEPRRARRLEAMLFLFREARSSHAFVRAANLAAGDASSSVRNATILWEGDAEARRNAIGSVSSKLESALLGSLADPPIPDLVALLRDRVVSAKGVAAVTAARLLADVGDASCIEPLQKAARSTSAALRDAATATLEKLRGELEASGASAGQLSIPAGEGEGALSIADSRGALALAAANRKKV